MLHNLQGLYLILLPYKGHLYMYIISYEIWSNRLSGLQPLRTYTTLGRYLMYAQLELPSPFKPTTWGAYVLAPALVRTPNIPQLSYNPQLS